MVMSDNGLPARVHGAKGAGSGPSANREENCGNYVGVTTVPTYAALLEGQRTLPLENRMSGLRNES
jgi:hypothetical protein